MKRTIFILAILAVLVSCSSDEEPTGTLDVNVKYEYNESESGTYPVGDPIRVYLFKDVNFATGPFTYVGNGIVKNDDTGESIQSFMMNRLDLGRTSFDGLEIKTYGVVLDMLDSKIEDFLATSINLKAHSGKGELELKVDIWPYDPWDLY